eukprot:938675-Rhodomonas_salina.1
MKAKNAKSVADALGYSPEQAAVRVLCAVHVSVRRCACASGSVSVCQPMCAARGMGCARLTRREGRRRNGSCSTRALNDVSGALPPFLPRPDAILAVCEEEKEEEDRVSVLGAGAVSALPENEHRKRACADAVARTQLEWLACSTHALTECGVRSLWLASSVPQTQTQTQTHRHTDT